MSSRPRGFFRGTSPDPDREISTIRPLVWMPPESHDKNDEAQRGAVRRSKSADVNNSRIEPRVAFMQSSSKN